MAELITSLEIHGFRSLSAVEVPALGKVNLVTGKNNAGKTSVLEAIRILASGGARQTLIDVLSYRDALSLSPDSDALRTAVELSPFRNLFTGFPDVSTGDVGFSISSTGSLTTPSISAKIAWFTRKVDDDGSFAGYEAASIDMFADGEVLPAFAIDVGSGRRRVIPLDRLLRRNARIRDPEPLSPCVFLDPFSSRSTSQMGTLWDTIALTDVEAEVVSALQIVSPDIEAVSVVGGDDRTTGRVAIARSAMYDAPVPLRTFGDGVNRLFSIILSLCNARNGILLVDEIENGLHFTAQTELWRTIFRLARVLNVQVFATTHSWDCVKAFQRAAEEDIDQKGALVRLTRRRGGKIVVTTFSEEELAIVTRDDIEVR